MTTGAVNPLAGYNPPAFFAPSEHDVVVIGGQTCPGIVTLDGFERKWKWDKKKGKGAQGVTPTMTGKDECSGTFTFYVYTALQFVLWEGFRPVFKYDPTRQNVEAVSVYHPSLADLDISSLYCEELSPLLHRGHGLWTCMAKMSEFTPVPKAAAVATPTQSKSSNNAKPNPAAPAPTDPLQIKIQQLVTQLRGS